MAKQITGRAFIRVNGNLLKSKPGGKLGYGGKEREAVIGDDSIHGYTEKLVAPTVECSISHDADTSLKELANITDATITFECDTGPVYVVRGAWLDTPPELTAGGGEVSLKFTGIECEEMK